MLGYAFQALREAVYGEHADRLLLVRYESLSTNPIGTLTAIYEFIGEPLFTHDPGHIEPCYDMIDFDMRLGTPGLHHVGSTVQARTRPTILPPDIFARFERDAFWDDLTTLPKAVGSSERLLGMCSVRLSTRPPDPAKNRDVAISRTSA